jgi:hypothetical protein
MQRMRTPPRQVRSQGYGTLIGNGWLREASRNRWPGSLWNVPQSKSALRKCMFLPVPEELRNLMPRVSSAGAVLREAPRAQARAPVAAREIAVRRNDPRMNVCQLPVYVPAASRHVAAWWEDPVALGSLLILVPPIGLAAVWSSKRYSTDARWALTVMTALTMCLVGAVVLAALTMR